MRKKCVLLLLLTSVLFGMSACRLMPDEDVLPARPILYSYETETVATETVVRGDLIQKKTVRCEYLPAKTETLSFALGSEPIDKVYVTQGQGVEAGQILAELKQDNLREQIAEQEYRLRVLQMQKTHLQEDRDLDAQKYDILIANLEQEAATAEGERRDYLLSQKWNQEQLRAELIAQYAVRIQEAEDAVYLQNLRINELKISVEERQLAASIDGTVTFVREVAEGATSVKGEPFITIADLDTTAFTVTGTDTQYFSLGMQVILTCLGESYEAYVAEPSELGIEEVDEDTQIVYLRLVHPNPSLKEKEKGQIEIITDERKNVLLLNADAIQKSNGESFVYVLDEEGMRSMQPVVTGLEADGMVEIVRGLQEGDNVILD